MPAHPDGQLDRALDRARRHSCARCHDDGGADFDAHDDAGIRGDGGWDFACIRDTLEAVGGTLAIISARERNELRATIPLETRDGTAQSCSPTITLKECQLDEGSGHCSRKPDSRWSVRPIRRPGSGGSKLKPDVAVLDLMMPTLNGTRRRARIQAGDTKAIVLLTGAPTSTAWRGAAHRDSACSSRPRPPRTWSAPSVRSCAVRSS